MNNGPLSGIRVVAFTQAWAGPSATELLGFLGADVIQIESASHPDNYRGGTSGRGVPPAILDPTRTQHPWNVAPNYNSVNLNKRGLAIEATTPEGAEIVRRLVALADVVVDNFSPRVMKAWGLDYGALRSIRPDIIQASLSAFGASGPLRDYRSIGTTIEAMSGLSSLLGYPGGRPMRTGTPAPDAVAGLWCAASIVTALLHRNRTGEGQFIDIGMMEAASLLAGDAFLEYTANGAIPARLGNRHRHFAPHGIYAAQGGWVAIAVEDEAQWSALRMLVKHPGLAAPRFAERAGRKQHEDALDEILASWVAGQEAGALEAILQGAGVIAARVRERGEILDHPALMSRGFGVEVDFPEAGTHRAAGIPWVMRNHALRVTRPSPLFGQHTFEVLSDWLRLTEAEYRDLVDRGVLDGEPGRSPSG